MSLGRANCWDTPTSYSLTFSSWPAFFHLSLTSAHFHQKAISWITIPCNVALLSAFDTSHFKFPSSWTFCAFTGIWRSSQCAHFYLNILFFRFLSLLLLYKGHSNKMLSSHFLSHVLIHAVVAAYCETCDNNQTKITTCIGSDTSLLLAANLETIFSS